MQRRQLRDTPRWRRRTPAPLSAPVQLSGRQARSYAREAAREHARITAQGPAPAAAANDTLARTGAWRFRLHLIPFAWLAVLCAAAAVLRGTPHPVPYALAGAWAAGILVVWSTRHLSRYARRAADYAAAVSAGWLPALTGAGFGAPVPALLAVTWAVFAATWIRHYRWRPGSPATAAAAAEPRGDIAVWTRLAARQNWTGQLGPRQDIPGGRQYPLILDGADTHIGKVAAQPRAIAAAYDKAITEAYVEPDPAGVESRGVLTILRQGSLEAVTEWDGQGFAADGIARAGRYADGSPGRIRLWVPRDGTRHGLAAGTTGSGKSALLDLIIWLALRSPVPVVPVILDPQQGQSLPQWRGRLLYAAGFDECVRMVRGLHAGFLDRSRRLAGMPWRDEDGYLMHGMGFFDPQLAGLPVVLPIIDEAPMLLSGDGNAKLRAEMVHKVGADAKLTRKAGGSMWLGAQVPSLGELQDQALRSMLVGGNVVCLRTGDKVSAAMVGLPADPSTLPRFFRDGTPTGGLGYLVSLDNRQAPFRADMIPPRMQREQPQVPQLEPGFLEAMDAAMRGTLAVPAAAPLPAPAAGSASSAGDDGTEGRRCIDAVWQVLADAGKPMERGEVIKWVTDLAQAWDRKAWSIRSITSALSDLADGKDPSRQIVKPAGGKGGVYQAVTTRAEESS